MGNLPPHRVLPARPFLNSGVDFCGPFQACIHRKKGSKSIKSYVAIFVCMATKAAHLELVNDLTTDAFVNALKRFTSRRGNVLNIYSDNATNFVGANHELNELNKLFQSKQHKTRLQTTVAGNGITWHFIPVRSPHFGGIWEAAVKSAKHHLRRVAGKLIQTYEELSTLLVQIEACLNSRPLIPLTDDSNDLHVLTPGHFLIGEALTAMPEPQLIEHHSNRLSHWKRLQQVYQQFWKKWSSEYLSTLQRRSKWKTSNLNSLSQGDVVAIKDDNLPPLHWRLGRVIELHPGSDSVVRVVTVKTSTTTSRFAVHRLCRLPVDDC